MDNTINKYSLNDRMGRLVREDYRLLLVMTRFGLPLGFGEKTVQEVCRQHGVDAVTFLAVANFMQEEDELVHTDVESLSILTLMDYLKRAHNYYLDFSLPAIRRKLIEAIDLPENQQISFLILKFFDEYVAEVREHMEFENRHEFHYVNHLMQGDVEAVLGQLGNGEAQLIHVGHTAPVIVEVAAGTLTAALQQMASHNAAGQMIQILVGQAKLVSQRSQEHGGVCRTAGEDGVSALGKTLHQRLTAVINVGIDQLVLDLVEVAHVVHILELAAFSDNAGDLIQQIVAEDITDLVAMQALLFGHGLQCVHGTGDIHAAGVGDHADLLLIGFLADDLHQADEVTGITCGRILHFLPLHDGESQFCQVVAGHIIQISVPDHVDCRIRAVAPEALAAANGDFFHTFTSFHKLWVLWIYSGISVLL